MIIYKESDYRAHPAYNYSKLKDFTSNKISYYYKHELNQRDDSSINSAMVIGSIVDCLLFQPEEFGNKYNIAHFPKPIGQMGEFLDELWSKTKNFIDEKGVITESLKNRLEFTWDVFKKKYPDKFKGKDLNFIIENFSKTDKNGASPQEYYIELLSGFNKITIEQKDYDKAEKIIETLKQGKYSSFLFKESPGIENLYQIGVVGDLNGFEVKGLYDIIRIDHNKKTIKGIDLKTTWQSDNFVYSFKKLSYYLQASIYHYLLNVFKKDMGYDDYTIDDTFSFLICDSSMQFLPHFQSVSKDTLDKGLNGFVDSYNIKYKGVIEIIQEIEFCKKNTFYDSIDLDTNKGFLNITL